MESKEEEVKKVLTGSESFFFVFYNYNGNENGRDVRHATICKTGKLKINQANTTKIRGENPSLMNRKEKMSDSFIVAASNDDFQLALFLFFFSFLNNNFHIVAAARH